MLLVLLLCLVGAFVLYTQVPALLIYWSQPWPVYGLLAAAVGTAIASRRRNRRRVVTIAVTTLVATLFVLYTVVFSQLSRSQLAVHVGDPFPDFTLQTSTNEAFSPAQLKGRSAALYVFYRGDW